MTNQPTIKKYRRRFTQDDINKAATALLEKHGEYVLCEQAAERIAKTILEANAEVIEGEFIFHDNGSVQCNQVGKIIHCEKLKQFQQEWEEVE